MRLLSEGFELTVDQDSGKLQNFRALDDELWQEIVKRGGKEAIAEFSKNTFTPGVLKTIPATVGATVNLPELAGRSVSVTVKKVTDDDVTAVIDGRDEQGNMNTYGVMVLTRNDGWLKQLMLVTNEQMERYGQKLNVRARLAMLPGDQPAQLNFDDWNASDNWFPIYDDKIDETLLKPPVGQALLPYEHGIYQSGRDGLELILPHEVQPQQATGKLKLTDIKALDAKQQPLDIQLQWVTNSSLPDETSVRVHAIPIGWNKQAELERTESFTATVDYFPTHYLTKTVSWKVGEQHLNIGGAKITIKPVADQIDTYEVIMSSTDDTQLMLFTQGLTGEYKGLPVEGNDFLSYSEQQVFNYYSNLQIPERYLFKLNETPTEVTFYAAQEAKKSTYSGEFTFIAPQAYGKHAKYPPLFESLLYGYGQDATKQKSDSFDDLQPEMQNGQSISMTLPADWDSSCQLRVVSDNEENGHKLTWLANDEQSNRALSTQYQLSTDDGVRTYFYGISVTSELSCDGQPQWQTLDYQPGDTPWLLPVADMDGIDLEQSVGDFIAHYHLMNASGQPLDIMSSNGEYPNLDENPKLSDILTSQQQLRVVGKVASIRHLSFVGEPVTRQWTTTFPVLP